MSSDWKRGEYGVYACTGNGVVGVVQRDEDAEFYRSRVLVNGAVVDIGEWDGLAVAIRQATQAMRRACWLRRFEPNCPEMPESIDADNDFDEDDE